MILSGSFAPQALGSTRAGVPFSTKSMSKSPAARKQDSTPDMVFRAGVSQKGRFSISG